MGKITERQKKLMKPKSLGRKVQLQSARDYVEGNQAVFGQSDHASAMRQNLRASPKQRKKNKGGK